MCNVGLLENVIPQINPSTRTTGKASRCASPKSPSKTLRTHDIVLIMPFLIPKIESFISLATIKTQATRVGNYGEIGWNGGFNSKIRGVSPN